MMTLSGGSAPPVRARQLELETFAAKDGDTEESLHALFGAHEPEQTVWLWVEDHHNVILGCARLIIPGDLPCVTIAAAAQAPWSVNMSAAMRTLDVDHHQVLELATISTQPEAPRAVVSRTLLWGVLQTGLAHGLPWIAATVHPELETSLARMGLTGHRLAEPAPWAGAPAMIPTLSHVATSLSRQRTRDYKGWLRLTTPPANMTLTWGWCTPPTTIDIREPALT